LFDGEVTIEEKVDGSQFSFGLIDGELQCRSHNQQLVIDEPEKMFAPTQKSKETLLREGFDESRIVVTGNT